MPHHDAYGNLNPGGVVKPKSRHMFRKAAEVVAGVAAVAIGAKYGKAAFAKRGARKAALLVQAKRTAVKNTFRGMEGM